MAIGPSQLHSRHKCFHPSLPNWLVSVSNTMQCNICPQLGMELWNIGDDPFYQILRSRCKFILQTSGLINHHIIHSGNRKWEILISNFVWGIFFIALYPAQCGICANLELILQLCNKKPESLILIFSSHILYSIHQHAIYKVFIMQQFYFNKLISFQQSIISFTIPSYSIKLLLLFITNSITSLQINK